MRSIVLIDDNQTLLDDLRKELEARLQAGEAEVRTWTPKLDEDPKATFDGLVDDETALVVTDYDLTSQGQTGLFGSSIVAWCKGRGVPVGDFSRGGTVLPREPDLFELRVPTEIAEAATLVAALFRGFRWISDELSRRQELLKTKSYAVVLSDLLGVPGAENEFALYVARLAPLSGALMETIAQTAPRDTEPTAERKRRLLAYLVGHLLLNSILRFPGPLASAAAVGAYIGSREGKSPDLVQLLQPAAYQGPFADVGPFYWLDKVDDILDGYGRRLPDDTAETIGELNRQAVESQLGRQLQRHDCPRCQGQNGGFYCPLTKRIVCLRDDCSVGPNSWIPPGARLCRIERDFFDEWSPILGL